MKINANQGQPKNKDFYDGAWHLTIDGQVVEVTEKVYRAYKQPLWAERKREEREKRCIISNGKGSTKRCTADCSTCQNQRTGSVLSLDKFKDDGLDVPGSINIEDILLDKMLLEELFKALEELDPENRLIIDLFSIGKSEREISANIGLSQKTINKRKAKLFEQLKERLNNWA